MDATLEHVLEGPSAAPPRSGRGAPAPAARRAAAGSIDALLVVGALALVLATSLAVATDEAVAWVALGWALLFAPLYFALYHAFDTGATPGQLELRLGLRCAGSDERPSPARALGRAYLRLLFWLLLVPAVADLVVLAASGRSLADRLTRTTVVRIALDGPVHELVEPTVPALREVFEPAAGAGSYLARGLSLLEARPRLLLGPVVVVYGALLVLAIVLGLLIVADTPADPEAVLFFVEAALLLLVSGVYWTQAVIVIAAEDARTGRNPPLRRVVARAVRRTNALSAVLALLLVVALLLQPLLPAFLLVGRLTLVAPALVLEDRRVFGAFARSWQLTAGRTWRTLGLVLVSGLLLTVGPTLFAIALGAAVAAAGAPWVWPVGLAAYAAAFLVVLAWLGAAWSLVYEDARRLVPPRERR
ncbi:MAG: RDD family protein [Pseudomonadota bacterium]